MVGARRESKQEFWTRVEREGRREQAEVCRKETLAEGNSRRQTQAWLVERFQPLDGTKTRAWPTPNSWAHGRVARKRPDEQEQLERDVLWVHANRDQPLEKAPTAGARLLLETAQREPATFLKIYLKCLPSIDKRERDRIEARRQKVKDQIEKLRKREAADKRAYYRELERVRIEAEKQAAVEAEARRKAEALKRAAEEESRRQKEKQEQDRLQREQAGKRSTNGRQKSVPLPATADREVFN